VIHDDPSQRGIYADPNGERTSWGWWIAAGVAGLAIYGIYSSANSPESNARALERRAIEVCWEEQARKSLTPGEQRFIAGACERMESEFQQKHGRKP